MQGGSKKGESDSRRTSPQREIADPFLVPTTIFFHHVRLAPPFPPLTLPLGCE